MNIGIIILAAGESTRMGTPKQAIPMADGKSLLQSTVEVALATPLRPIVVVVGANKAEVVPELKGLPVTIVDNAFWQEGMATSVKVGLAGLFMMEPRLGGILMLVCDQPHITPGLLEEMMDVFLKSNAKAVACRYDESWGVPVLIGRELLAELTELTGDQGAKPLLKKYIQEVVFVDFEKGNIDLDTPEDVEKFRSN